MGRNVCRFLSALKTKAPRIDISISQKLQFVKRYDFILQNKSVFSYFIKTFPENITDIPVDADRLPLNFRRRSRLSEINAGINIFRAFRRHLPKWIFDDPGGVVTHTKLQKERPKSPVSADKILIPFIRPIPAIVLHKGIIRPQIHCHSPAALGTSRYKLRRDTHILLPSHHFPYNTFIVKGLLTAGKRALKKPVIPLSVKQPVLVKARLLEPVVNICGQHKIILALDQLKKPPIGAVFLGVIAVYQNIP